MPKPKWHPKWKLMRVISGHMGWVRAIAVEPGNKWFATGIHAACAPPPLRAALVFEPGCVLARCRRGMGWLPCKRY